MSDRRTYRELMLTEQRDQLRKALEGLLLSADRAWEENNEGHDWREAVAMARAALGWAGPIYADGEEATDG